MIDFMSEVFRLLPPADQERIKKSEERMVKLREQMRQELAEVLRRVADALAYPNVARADLEEAQKYLIRALSIAAVLDPEEV